MTGVAGPDGGTDAKPIGLTYVGVDGAHGTDVRRLVFSGDRVAIREAAAGAVLECLIEHAQLAAQAGR